MVAIYKKAVMPDATLLRQFALACEMPSPCRGGAVGPAVEARIGTAPDRLRDS